jgi:hypothetical protein
LRKPPTSEVIQKNPGPERKLRRAVLFSVAGRFVAVAALLTVVALYFVLVPPALRQSASSTSSEITGSITLPRFTQEENGSKPALAEVQGVSRRSNWACCDKPQCSAHFA